MSWKPRISRIRCIRRMMRSLIFRRKDMRKVPKMMAICLARICWQLKIKTWISFKLPRNLKETNNKDQQHQATPIEKPSDKAGSLAVSRMLTECLKKVNKLEKPLLMMILKIFPKLQTKSSTGKKNGSQKPMIIMAIK